MATMGSDFIDSNIRGNRWHSAVLVAGMIGILAFIGWFIAGTAGLVISTGLCLFTVVLGPAVSPQFVLRMYKAQPIEEHHSPQLMALYAELIRRANLSTSPTLYYIPSRTLNAFAVGNRKQSAVAITDGLLRVLEPREIAGVLAHEISHIRHRDMLVLGIADTVSRIIATISQIGQFLLLLAIPTFLMSGNLGFLIVALVLFASPVLSNLLQLALSRTREFNADLGAVALTGDASGLASALQKLERITSGKRFPWLIPGRKGHTAPATLRTHPPTEERIRRIMEAGESIATDRGGESWNRSRRLSASQDRVRRGPRWHATGLWY